MFQEKWAALTERGKKVAQVIAGLLISAAIGFFLFSSSSTDDGMWELFAAVALALIMPNILETQTGAKLPIMRKMLLIGLVLFVVITAVLALTQ